MSNTLSELFEVASVILDKTIKTVTIPDKVVGMTVIPVNVDIHFGLSAEAFTNMSGSFYVGPTDTDVIVLGLSAMPLNINNKPDIANRDFYLASLESGSACTAEGARQAACLVRIIGPGKWEA